MWGDGTTSSSDGQFFHAGGHGKAIGDWQCYRNFGPGEVANFGPISSLNLRFAPIESGCPVDWKAKVELFEQLRREHGFQGRHDCRMASKFDIHRRAVRRASQCPTASFSHYPARIKPKLGVVADFIDKVLDEDVHVYASSATPPGTFIAGSLTLSFLTPRSPSRPVATMSRARRWGWTSARRSCRKVHSWAQEAQVDWYEAWVDLGDERTKVQVFAMRLDGEQGVRTRRLITTPRSAGHFWKRTNTPASPTSAAYFACCVMIILPVRSAKSCAATARKRRCGSWRSAAHWQEHCRILHPGEGHEEGRR